MLSAIRIDRTYLEDRLALAMPEVTEDQRERYVRYVLSQAGDPVAIATKIEAAIAARKEQ